MKDRIRINKQKLLISFVLVIILLLGMNKLQNKTVFAAINDYQASKVDLDAKSAIAVDAKSGQVFYAKNANKKLPVASMSKLITIYLTLKAVEDKKISWDQKVTPTEQMVRVSKNPDYSGVPLEMGHKYTIRELYQATLIASANAPAMLLAQTIGGSQVGFVKQMQAQVKAWGIKNAKIYTPDGLPNYTQGPDAYPGVGKQAENELSATDMAIVVDKLLTDFPKVIETTKIAHMNFDDQGKITKMENWNWMLKGLSQYNSNYPLDGLKTGTTDAAGACFAGTMVKNGRRIITIVMGAPHKDGNDPSRFTQTKKLLNYVFSNYQLFILKKNTTIKGAKTVVVPNGKNALAHLVLQKDTDIWLTKNSNLTGVANPKQISAPKSAGEKVGVIEIKSLPSIKDVNGVQLPATITRDAKKTNIFVRMWRIIFGVKIK